MGDSTTHIAGPTFFQGGGISRIRIVLDLICGGRSFTIDRLTSRFCLRKRWWFVKEVLNLNLIEVCKCDWDLLRCGQFCGSTVKIRKKTDLN